MTQSKLLKNYVGPVLNNHKRAHAIITAIRQLNPGVAVQNRGAYLRVLSPHYCVLKRSHLEQALGEEVSWPNDLESIMPSFKGRLEITNEQATWS